ncbi:MAG: hypothetical protein JXC85_04075 [Candidatus Aenigmarchaeota archaeon]|nr:hypothetical protein [Candidatus Aenigmarchaeota archaeon]
MAQSDYGHEDRLYGMIAVARGLQVGFLDTLFDMQDQDFFAFNKAADVIEIEGQLSHTDEANPEFEHVYEDNVQTMKSLLHRYGIPEDQLEDSHLASLGTPESVNKALDRLKHESQDYEESGEVTPFDPNNFLYRVVIEYFRRVARDN